ncbi:sulfatase-like hydrolase/transferase [Candidatus Peregrinibacteria bacterium]|nr:sulfatase-like hydrolase/transferase [Candidatus Peregrinibacteria bacterium]
MFKKPLILYPFLFAIYPILFLYSHNIQELVLTDIYIPLAIAFFASLLSYLFANFLIKDREKSALIVLITVIFFFSYGAVSDFFARVGFALRDRYLFSAFILAEVCAAYILIKIRKDNLSKNATAVLNVIAITLVLFNLPNILSFNLKKDVPEEKKDLIQQNAPSQQSTKPDIYYIILDEYMRPDKVKEIWGYDDAVFTDYIKKRGFFIAEKSESRAGSTHYSLASSLNMKSVLPPEADLATATKMIQNNKVIDFLKSQGYKTVIFNNSNNIGDTNADYNFSLKDSENVRQINFSQIILKNSMAKPFLLLSTGTANPVFTLSRDTTLFTLSKISDLDEVPSPKFVFAHIESPHLPFVFDRDGGRVDSSHEDDWENKKYYLDQYIFISGQAQKVVENLMEKHKTNPPIIVIQSDHGIRKNYFWEGKTKSISYISNDKWKFIFNAYYLPGFKGVIPDDISPIQTFGLIFSYYFDRKT